MYKHFFKRLIDLCIVFMALLLIWPVLLMITIWLHFANKGAGAFFIQERLGMNGKIFKLIKFKTMTDEKDDDGVLLPDAVRLTKVGRLVRNLSIDELPQLINVLKGDMSIVGPRPLTPIYMHLYSESHKRRMLVKPGITGLAQVNGRNHCMLSKKFMYDLTYVDNISFWGDLKIIFQTVYNVVHRVDIGEGASDAESIDDLGFMDRYRELVNKK